MCVRCTAIFCGFVFLDCIIVVAAATAVATSVILGDADVVFDTVAFVFLRLPVAPAREIKH